MFDGPMCRLEGIQVAGDNLLLAISRTSYKAFVGTNMAGQGPNEPIQETELANPIGLSVALESGDGLLLLGRRNNRVAYYPGHIHPFAGAMEGNDQPDVFADALRELREELGLRAADLSELRLVAIVADRLLRQPELIFIGKARVDSRAIEHGLDPTEHCGILTLHREQIDAALADTAMWTPVGLAAAMLFGREKYGQNWFELQLKRMRADRPNA